MDFFGILIFFSNLFKNYMDIKFIFGFQHFGDRINNSFLNIIEMVPINQFSDEKLEDINYFSSEVSLKISDFIIPEELTKEPFLINKELLFILYY